MTPLLIVASHGRLAQSALDSACQIFGAIEPAAAIGLDPNGRLEDIEQQIMEERVRHGADRPTVLLVDLFGGSCSNVGAKILRKQGEGTAPMRVIAGFNLAMLIEFAFNKEKYDLDVLADRMIEAGRKACLDVNAKLKGVGK